MKHKDFVALVKSAIAKYKEQNARSVKSTTVGGCVYLNAKGHCCIVGHMMPDDETRRAADNQKQQGIQSLFDNGFEWAQQFTNEQIRLMWRLQEIHDSTYTPERIQSIAVPRMEQRLENYCEDYRPNGD